MITQERLKEVLNYDPESGEFTWKVDKSKSATSGSIAGGFDELGYVVIQIDGRQYKCHRLAFVYMGEELPRLVDHMNGIKHDNRWCNLRPATPSQNARNRVRGTSSSGVKGVSWEKLRGKWKASIKNAGKSITIGYFPDLIGAELAVRRNRIELHGEYANHG